MLENGVSIARVRYAFNSTNVEGWGLYSEYIVRPYMPLEGQLVSLDYRLLRAARAFLDPELQAGKIQPADAKRVLEQDVVQSPAFAEEEVERYTYRAPGQANSYYYGYTKLIALRKDTEAAHGSEVQPEEVSRLHPGARLAAARPDAQSSDGGVRRTAGGRDAVDTSWVLGSGLGRQERSAAYPWGLQVSLNNSPIRRFAQLYPAVWSWSVMIVVVRDIRVSP